MSDFRLGEEIFIFVHYPLKTTNKFINLKSLQQRSSQKLHNGSVGSKYTSHRSVMSFENVCVNR